MHPLEAAYVSAFLAIAITRGPVHCPPGPATLPGTGPLGWPLSPRPSVLRAFDPPDKPWLSGHRGVDLGPVLDGEPVAAPADGMVSFVGVVVDRPVITIDHGNGLRSSFEPATAISGAGDPVGKGEVIGSIEPVSGHCARQSMPALGGGTWRRVRQSFGFRQDMRPSILLPLG